MVASEAAPFAKTGGLADMVGSLPAALKALGHEVAVLLPRYATVDLKNARRVYDSLPIWLPPQRYDTSLYLVERETPFYFLDYPPLYDRPGLYGEEGEDYPDNHIRFAVLAQAALEFCRRVWRPDILHAHDWQAGLAPAYLRTIYGNDPTFLGIRSLFTIHNMGYHGLFPAAALDDIGLAGTEEFRPDGLEFFGKVCYLKGGLNYADALNTVSPTYAREIQTAGIWLRTGRRAAGAQRGAVRHFERRGLYGMESGDRSLYRGALFQLGFKRQAHLQAGPDKRVWAAGGSHGCALDRHRFAVHQPEGRRPDRGGRRRPGSRRLLYGGAGRGRAAVRGTLPGDGGSGIHPRIAVRIGYDNALAHKIEAGADLFLMPSRYEPCGLNQIYSLKIRHRAGGARDGRA